MTEQNRPLNESGQESPDTLLYHGGAKAFAKMGEWATSLCSEWVADISTPYATKRGVFLR